MVKKLLLSISAVLFFLFSNSVNAQCSYVCIDSLIVSSPALCNGDNIDLTTYVDNDTNTVLGGSPQYAPYQIKAFTSTQFGVLATFTTTVTTGSSLLLNDLPPSSPGEFYYVLLVDSVPFYNAYPGPMGPQGPQTQLFYTQSQFTNVLTQSFVYDFDTITIPQPVELSNTTGLVPGTENQCFGDNTASQIISMSGGTAPYFIDGVAISGNSDTLFSLSAGTYNFTVTDANGCSSSSSSPSSFTISEPSELIPNGSITSNYNGQDVSCFGANDGKITASSSGGTGTIEYSIDGTNYLSNADFTGLSAGTYTIYYRDANACIKTESLTLTEPADLSGTLVGDTSVTCFQSCDAQINMTSVSGGTPTYLYSLNGGGPVNNPSPSGLCGNQYHEITIVDANGCSFSDSIFVSEPDLLTFSADVSSNLVYNGFGVSCYGSSDGEITFSNILGGTPNYQFSIDGNNFYNDSVFNLLNGFSISAGNYSLQIQDAFGCVGNPVTINVSEPDLLDIGGAAQPVSCYDLCDGIITINVLSADPSLLSSLIYNVSGISQYQNPVFTNLCGELSYGDYYLSATDANGCIDSVTLTIPEPLDWIYVMDSLPEFCSSGQGSASIVIDPTTGTSPYTYVWNDANSQTTSTATSLVSGTYDVTVTDDNGCSFTESVFVDEADLSLTFDTVAACNNALNASLTAIPNGTPPFTYSWTGPNGFTATTATINNLPSSTQYTVTVTDANACSVDSTISTPASAIVFLQIDYTTSQLFVPCYGDPSNGIEVIASGGTGPNTYQYSIPLYYPVPQNTGVYTGLFAGTYSIHTSDGNGCTDSVNVPIYEPTELNSYTILDTSVSCFGGSDGGAALDGSGTGQDQFGGTGPYTYLWSNGGTNPYINNVSAGVYSVVITDDNGCTSSADVTITQPSQLTTQTTVLSNSNCSGSQTLASGEIEVSASGATPGYTYLWSNGATTSSINFLLPGLYSVVVTDNNGCVAQADTAEILAGENPDLQTTVTDVTCFGFNDGVITPTATGGATPYLFSNDGGSTYIPSGNVFSNLDGGFYFVTVVDSLGCLDTDSVYVEEPDLLEITSIQTNNVSCNGANDGELTVNHLGGRAPYTYLWNDASSQTTMTASGLSPGNYSVIVTDSSGCIAVSNSTITEPDILEIVSISSDSALCYGQSDGFVYLSVTGGTQLYNFNWSFGGTNANTNAPAGLHTVNVTDANGCTVDSLVLVEQPNEIITNFSKDSVSCLGLADGWATASVTGGTNGFSYLWSNGSDSSSSYGLSAGYHYLTITDGNMCVKLDSVEIYEPNYFINIDSILIDEITCYSANNGTISVFASGGLNIEYFKSNGLTTTSQVNNVFTGVSPDTYTITVEDFKGCTASETIVLTQPDSLYIDTTIFSHIQCFGLSNGSIDNIIAYGGTGSYLYSINGGNQYSNTAYFNGYSAGSYTVEVYDENNCVSQDLVIIEEPSVLSVSITPSNWNNYQIQCNGDASGTADFVITGGAAPYLKTTTSNGDTVITTNGDTLSSFNSNVSGLSAGTYDFIVEDAYGCIYLESIVYNEPDSIQHSFVASHVTCDEWNNGSLTDVVSGGVGSPLTYYYLWTTGDTTYSLSNLSVGMYGITVTDENGCSDYAQFEINDTNKLIVAIDAVNTFEVSCFDYCDGEIALDISGGVPSVTPSGNSIYTCQWNDTLLQTTATAVGLCVNNDDNNTTYTCIINDAQGCYDTITYTLSQPEELIVSTLLVEAVDCFGANTGKIKAEVTGGNISSPYTYQWNNGISTANNNNIIAGSYVVVVTDIKGCTDTTEILLEEPTILSVAITETDVTCFGYDDGEITATATGGTPEPGIPPTYNYLWDDPLSQTTQIATALSPDIYSVTVTDANGCTVTSQTVNISGPSNALIVTADSTDETCLLNDGSAQVYVLGGVPNYDFSWSGPGGYTNTNSSISNLPPGLYTVEVVDENGCEVTTTTTVNAVTEILLPGNVSLLDTTICLGSTITLNVQEKPGLFYTWDDGSTDANKVVSPKLPTNNYFLTVFDPNCLNPYQVEAIVRVTYVKNEIESNASTVQGSNPIIKIGDEINLRSKNLFDAYSWSNGSVSRDIDVQPLSSSWFSLTVDSSGCLGIDSIYVVLGVIPYDAITPNGDNMNDTWEILDIENYPQAIVKVFNRWGEIVHETSGGGNYKAWDGTFESEQLPVGTYYYVIDLNNNEEPQTGPITIVR